MNVPATVTFPIFSTREQVSAFYADVRPSVRDREGNTGLFYCKTGEAVRAVLEEGVEPNTRNRAGLTAVDFLSVTNGARAAVVATLIDAGGKRGADLDREAVREAENELDGLSPKGPRYKPVRTTASLGEVEVAKHIIREFMGRYRRTAPDYDFTPDKSGNSILHRLEEYPVDEAKKIVLVATTKKIDFDAQNNKGETAIHKALRPEIAGLLLDAGARIDIADQQGQTAVVRGCQSEALTQLYLSRDPEAFLVPDNDGATILHRTRSSDVIKTVGTSRKVFSVLSATEDKEGRRPHHLVKNLDSMKALIEAGADVRARSAQGLTALHFAENEDICRFLVSRGISPNDQANGWQKAPLHTARSAEVVSALIESGAKPELEDKYGATPAHTARNVDVASRLVEVSNLGHKAYAEERTALMSLADRGVMTKSIAEAAQRRDPDIGLERDAFGRSVLHYVRDLETAKAITDVLECNVDRSVMGRRASDEVGDGPLKEFLKNYEKTHEHEQKQREFSYRDED